MKTVTISYDDTTYEIIGVRRTATHGVGEHGPRSGVGRGRLRALFDHIEGDDERSSAAESASAMGS